MTLPRTCSEARHYYNVDLSVAKLWKFKERYSGHVPDRVLQSCSTERTLQRRPAPIPVRAATFGCTCTTPDGAGFTNAVLGPGAARDAQLGLKLTF